MIQNYFKVAWRNLVRNKTYSTINILGLTFGVIACVTIYLVTSFELSYDRFHTDKDRVYRLVSEMQMPSGEKQKLAMIPDPATLAIRKEFTGLESVAASHTIYASVSVINGNNVKNFYRPKAGRDISEVILAEPEYFGIFKYEWLAGTPSSLNEPFKVVLAESKAHKYFGVLTIQEMMGKEIVYNDSARFIVAGIVKDWKKNSDFAFTEFLSYSTVSQESFNKVFDHEVDLSNWMFWSGGSQTFVKLEKGVSPAQVTAQLTELINKNTKFDHGEKMSYSLQPLSDIHFNTSYEDMYARKAHLPTLYGLMAIAVFILLIAAINFINLSTAQSLRRAKEIGVRKVLGSNRGKLIFQFLSETFLLTVIAILLAVLLVPVVLSSLHSLIPGGVALHLSDPVTIIFLIVVCLVTSLLAGFYPARILSSYLPVLSLKGLGAERTNQKSYLRKGLIIFQFTVSLVLIIGTLVISNQMHYLLSKDMGFTKDAIINISPDWKYGGDKAKVLDEKMRQLPGVQLTSVDMGTPADKGHWGTNVKCKEVSDVELQAQMLGGNENYLPLYQLQIVAGRNLQNSDTIKEFLINATCARKLGFKKPEEAIGKILETGMSDGNTRKQCPIVGVISDFHTQSLHAPIKPAFMIESKTFCRSLSLKLNTKGKQAGDVTGIIANIEKLWKEVYPNEKFEYTFFDETIASFYGKEQKTAGIMNLAMLAAIFISCMGLFGLATFTAQQRTKEIGIRKVLGASVPGIISMLSRDFLKPVIIAIFIASPIAYYFMHQWLQEFAYRTGISWWIFLLAGIAAIVIAILTVSFQAIRAAIVNPAKSLRTE